MYCSSHQRLAARVQITEVHLKMAEVPDMSVQLVPVTQLSNGSPSPFPLLRVGNTFVLPGVPHLLRQKWVAVKDALGQFQSSSPFFNRCAFPLYR